jgi:hypothetical protein
VRWLPVLMFVSHSSFEHISRSNSIRYICYSIKDSDHTDASRCPLPVKTLPFHRINMFNIQVFWNVTSCHRVSSPPMFRMTVVPSLLRIKQSSWPA